MAKEYVLGRGELFISIFNPNTSLYGAFRYMGNTPEFNVSVETDSLDHYSMDRGVGEKDATVVTSTNRSATIVADEITGPNLALFLFGSTSTIAVSALAAVVVDTIAAVELDRFYALGVTAADPVGVLKVIYPGAGATLFAVKNTAGSTTYVAGTDYIFDARTAMVKILKGGAITAGQEIKISYAEAAYSYEEVKSGAQPIQAGLKYKSYNAYGAEQDWHIPLATVRPNGDFALKAEADWQSMPFELEILAPGNGLSAIYCNNLPVPA
jgi:hypothetical protein